MSEPAKTNCQGGRRWWSNPILRRYARSRLRPQALGVGLWLIGMSAGFLFFFSRTVGHYRGGLGVVDTERAPLVPLLVLQAILLFFVGTGQVAGGITAEADEGTLDYQRLSPMRPLAKVLGYLLGLPLREWCLFGATLPFTAWGLWKGEVAVGTWLPVYAALLSSAILYHLTGLVAGTVVKNRRWAFLVSLGAIFLLYTVIPQAAKFGLVFFKYLTLWPVIDENLANLLPREAGGILRLAKSLEPDVRFFGLHFSEAAFTLISQGVLSLTLVVMLWRRWRRAESHLLGKGWALGGFVWVQLVLLGNALPLIEPGLLFPSRQFARRFLPAENWEPGVWEALGMIGLYGLVTLLLMVVLTVIITPSAEEQVRGLRRGQRLGWRRVPRFSDAASSFWFVGLMALAGAAGWTVFAERLMGSSWFAGHPLGAQAGPTFGLVLLGAGLSCQAILEGWGGRRLFLVAVLLGILPLLTGGIVGTVGSRSLVSATWLAGLSPVAAPVYAAAVLLPTVDLPQEVGLALPRAFWFWQGVTALVAVWLGWRRRQIWGERAAAVAAAARAQQEGEA